MIDSFDVFDTLIGRLCYTGKNIFDIIEKKTKLKEFKNNRIKFETQTRNFDKTYDLLEIYYNKNMKEIKNLELKLELEMSFPIIKYLKNVKKMIY